MTLVLSFASLFLSVVLLQLGAGGLAPLDALSGLAAGFSRAEVGMLGSAHFTGFLFGCWWAPRLMGTVGHSRSYAVFTAMGVIGILAHTITAQPLAWIAFRVMAGICIAGAYTVIEAWLQARVDNANRGRAMGAYRMVDVGASLAAQLVISVLQPGAYLSYNLLAIVCCCAILPLTMTRTAQPEVPAAPRLRPRLALQRSPLGAAGVVVAGVTAAAFRMVGPVYGVEVGLSADQIALFLAAFVAGGALSQWPAGWLADRFDRRRVLIWVSVAALIACAVTVAVSQQGTTLVMVASVMFGLTTFPIYSISAAHAHDFATSSERVELSAALMFLYAVGAIASPWLTSRLIETSGPAAMFAFVSVAHVGLIIFGLIRMRRRGATTRTRYVFTPRTSFMTGRLFGSRRDPRE